MMDVNWGLGRIIALAFGVGVRALMALTLVSPESIAAFLSMEAFKEYGDLESQKKLQDGHTLIMMCMHQCRRP